MRFHLVAAALLAVSAAACTTDLGPAPEPPVLNVTAPARGLMQSGLGSVEVRGTVTPSEAGSPVTQVIVNGGVAPVAADGTWSTIVQLSPGVNRIATIATAADGGMADDTRGVLTGRFLPSDTMITNAISAALSKEAFTTLADTAANLVETADLAAMVMPMNPVVKKGLASDGGEDCLYGKVSVRPGLDLTTADIAIVPGDAGLALDVTLHDLYIPLHARYAAACLDGDTDITIRATTARIRGTITVVANAGRFDVTLVSPQVTFTGFDLRASGLPGAVVSLLDLDNTIGNFLANTMEKMIAPMVKDAIAGVHIGPQTISLLDKDVTVEVSAAGVGFDAAGAEIALDSKISVAGGAHQFYFTDDQVPPSRGDAGFQLAVADDTINQLLTTFWAAGGLDLSIAKNLGNYDNITLEAKLPPVVTAGAEGSLHVAMPDLVAHLSYRGQEVTVVAMNVEMGLKVTPNPSAPNIANLTVEPPRITADVISDLSGLRDESIEGLLPFMIEHELATFTQVFAAIPLPAFAGIRLSNLSVGTSASYVTVSGSIN